MVSNSFFEINGVGSPFPCNDLDIWSDWINSHGNYTQFSLDSNNNVLYNGLKLVINNSPVTSSDLVAQGTAYDRDLSGTKWIFNSSVDTSLETEFAINFISNNHSYQSLRIGYNEDWDVSNSICYDDNEDVNEVYYSGWTFKEHRSIFITGGPHATDNQLIGWLERYAKLVEVIDLTDTSWLFDDEIDIEALNIIFGYPADVTVSFTYNNNTYDRFVAYYDGDDVSYLYFVNNNNPLTVYQDGWLFNERLITFTGGTDVANPDLIVWLTSNATYQEPQPQPQPSHINKIGNLSIIKKKFGNLTVVKEVINGVTIYEDSGEDPTPVWDETDLTGTTWLINDEPNITDLSDRYVNFTDLSGNSFTRIRSRLLLGVIVYTDTSSNDVNVWEDPNGWVDSSYKTITFTGGTDATNALLIAWLKENATLVSYTPKVGYSVTVNYSGPYSVTVYDGEDNTGRVLVELYDEATVMCTTGKLYFDALGGVESITGSNGATSENPSTITADGASITIYGGSYEGGN